MWKVTFAERVCDVSAAQSIRCAWRTAVFQPELVVRREGSISAGLQPSAHGRSFRAIGGLRAGDAVALLQEFYVTGNPRGARRAVPLSSHVLGRLENNYTAHVCLPLSQLLFHTDHSRVPCHRGLGTRASLPDHERARAQPRTENHRHSNQKEGEC